jgi:hypothetical protein
MSTLKTSPEREKTFRVAIFALKSNPAYLTLFCLGLMGGPVVAVAIFRPDPRVAIAATVAWIIFLVASILVVAYVESRRPQTQDSPFEPSDQSARKTFLGSQSAEDLSGRWRVYWYEGRGEDRKAYDPDPEEIADISTNGPALFVHSYDPSTKSEYWFFGRLSETGDVTLNYWSKPEKGMLTGVLFLVVDKTFEKKGKKMCGWWQGRTRDGKVTTGEVEFVKEGFIDTPTSDLSH